MFSLVDGYLVKTQSQSEGSEDLVFITILETHLIKTISSEKLNQTTLREMIQNILTHIHDRYAAEIKKVWEQGEPSEKGAYLNDYYHHIQQPKFFAKEMAGLFERLYDFISHTPSDKPIKLEQLIPLLYSSYSFKVSELVREYDDKELSQGKLYEILENILNILHSTPEPSKATSAQTIQKEQIVPPAVKILKPQTLKEVVKECQEIYAKLQLNHLFHNTWPSENYNDFINMFALYCFAKKQDGIESLMTQFLNSDEEWFLKFKENIEKVLTQSYESLRQNLLALKTTTTFWSLEEKDFIKTLVRHTIDENIDSTQMQALMEKCFLDKEWFLLLKEGRGKTLHRARMSMEEVKRQMSDLYYNEILQKAEGADAWILDCDDFLPILIYYYFHILQHQAYEENQVYGKDMRQSLDCHVKDKALFNHSTNLVRDLIKRKCTAVYNTLKTTRKGAPSWISRTPNFLQVLEKYCLETPIEMEEILPTMAHYRSHPDEFFILKEKYNLNKNVTPVLAKEPSLKNKPKKSVQFGSDTTVTISDYVPTPLAKACNEAYVEALSRNEDGRLDWTFQDPDFLDNLEKYCLTDNVAPNEISTIIAKYAQNPFDFADLVDYGPSTFSKENPPILIQREPLLAKYTEAESLADELMQRHFIEMKDKCTSIYEKLLKTGPIGFDWIRHEPDFIGVLAHHFIDQEELLSHEKIEALMQEYFNHQDNREFLKVQQQVEQKIDFKKIKRDCQSIYTNIMDNDSSEDKFWTVNYDDFLDICAYFCFDVKRTTMPEITFTIRSIMSSEEKFKGFQWGVNGKIKDRCETEYTSILELAGAESETELAKIVWTLGDNDFIKIMVKHCLKENIKWDMIGAELKKYMVDQDAFLALERPNSPKNKC